MSDVTTQRCTSGEPQAARLCGSAEPGAAAGNKHADFTDGSHSDLMPCGPEVGGRVLARRQRAPCSFATTTCRSAPAQSTPTSRDGGKLPAAGIARRVFWSPPLGATVAAVNLPTAARLNRRYADEPIAERTPVDAVDGSTECNVENRIRFVRPPQRSRHAMVSPSMMAETITLADDEHFDSGYCGPLHLLIAHQHLSRHRGVTSIEGLPDSTRQNLTRTLTFVPAGRRFREWHSPETPAHITYIYIHPSAMALAADGDINAKVLVPRVHFHHAVLWETVLKVKTLVEGEGVRSGRYGNALGVVLTHELVNSIQGVRDREGLARGGGLTAWQRRLVARHVEEHLAEQLPISTLAELARLSRYHFCRSFRDSFGVSPHRYHLHRRAERAKTLLANPALSVTEIALDLGFRETSSFSTAFRKLVGRTPTGYRRSLPPSQV